MSASFPDRRTHIKKAGRVYLLLALLCALFSAVYEAFSHGVYAAAMIFAFLYPLAGGALPCLLLGRFSRRLPGRAAENLYHAGVATLAVGSLFRGALEIYGTTNQLTVVYWAAGAGLMAAGLALFLVGRAQSDKGTA